jgi:hypothetical protein
MSKNKPEMSSDSEPQTFEDESGSYQVDLSRLFEQVRSNPVMDLSVVDLLGELENKGWIFDETDETRIDGVDLAHPIILDERRDLVDGSHRLLKAYKNKLRFIKSIMATDAQIKKSSTMN